MTASPPMTSQRDSYPLTEDDNRILWRVMLIANRMSLDCRLYDRLDADLMLGVQRWRANGLVAPLRVPNPWYLSAVDTSRWILFGGALWWYPYPLRTSTRVRRCK